eukprot:6206943-Alexandrium_andersonii.AAC.1
MVPDQGGLRRCVPPHGLQQHPVASRCQRRAVEGVLRHMDAGVPWPEGLSLLTLPGPFLRPSCARRRAWSA